MRVTLCLLLSAVYTLADKNGNNNRRTKPFISDAVGNTLPPPTNVPATVGSPINLLTPDKYEFYTFDESGELVKRLMTLEEIQAIVAAGEDSEGLVTFANDNQPTIAFNFSQPPYTKVHSVVTNVQNVLKAQMEAHKNKPLVPPTLDTPDVSDSWSLILPSIFGNSGVDIAPEKSASNFTPETETMEENINGNDRENSLSKEGDSKISSSTTVKESDNYSTTTPAEVSKASLTSSTSTTMKAITTKKTSTTAKPSSTTTIRKKIVSTIRPRTTTTKPTTTKPSTTTTVKVTATTLTPSITTVKPTTTTTTPTTTIFTTKDYISNDIPTYKPISYFEKISTFIPVSTVKYETEKTTESPVQSTKVPFVYSTTTKRSPSATTKSPQPVSSTEIPKLHMTMKTPTTSTNKMDVTTVVKDPELERVNLTTITTQSVSPSTSASSTEYLMLENSQPNFADNSMKDDDTVMPLFDVAQSISQIASDLGNNYQPIPTSNNLLDTNKMSVVDMESKENLDMDIPNDEQNKNKNDDNFIKISTIDPHPQQKDKKPIIKTENKIETKITTTETISTTENEQLTTIAATFLESTTIDPILSESMGDLLSQVVHEAPQPTLDSNVDDNSLATTERDLEISTKVPTHISIDKPTTNDLLSSTENNVVASENEAAIKVNTENEIAVKTTTEKETILMLTTENNILNDIVTQNSVFQNITTEKIIPLKIDTTNFSSSPNNNVSLDDKIKINDDNSNEFVKISVSAITNSSNAEQNGQNISDAKIIEKDDSLNKITTSKKQDDNGSKKTVIAEQYPTESINEVTNILQEITTKPANLINHNSTTEAVSQSNENKTTVGDQNVSKPEKNPETLQKIDEFKKKIQKVNDEEMAIDRNNSWKLISTVTPPKGNDLLNEKIKPNASIKPGIDENKNVYSELSKKNEGLEVTTKDLGDDIAQFIELCHKLAFRYWNTIYENIDKKRSFVFSPYSVTSMLAMIFMGARGATSGEMNEILKLDDMVTFNPHFTLKNISDSIEPTPSSGIAVSAFVRELFSDRNKGKILTFYKERALHFYSGHVEEINFKLISDIIRRRTNLLVKKHTLGKIPEYIKTNSIVMKPPLAAFSTNIFQTDCTGTSVEGRDGEMYFVVSPNVRQRRLVPVPAVVYKSGFLAGYDPVLDATAAALGNGNSIVSTIFLMPGQPGDTVQDDDLQKLENGLIFYSTQEEKDTENVTPFWNRILKTLLPRAGLELQIPRFSHKSVFNVSSTLREMGLKDMFDANHADLGGLNGPTKDLYLSDMIQMTSFATCGEGMVGEQHHIEEYPETSSVARRRTSRWADWDEPRDYQRAFHDPHDVGEAMHLPLHLRPRQARVPTRSVQPARIKFDRPFLFFVRHNPTGMILYVGRYNPRLLP